MTQHEITFYTITILVLMGACWFMTFVPWCNDKECQAAHQRHTVLERARDIERTHGTFHTPDRPQPLCSLCQARKRDDP